jgi:hypothetical protein
MTRKQLFTVLLFIGLFAIASGPAVDPDLGWHLRTGALIANSHHIPHQDPFSFTYAGEPWTAHEWLSDLAIYGLWRLGGTGALILFFATVIAAAFAFIYSRCQARPFGAGVLLLWGAVVTVPSWGVRPQMFTLLLASAFLFILDRYLCTDRARLLYCLPALMVVWVNLHAGYAIGIALVILYAIAEVPASFATARNNDQRHERHVRLKLLSLAALACITAIPLNPNGFRLYLYPFQTLGAPSMMRYIREWFSPDFHQGIYRVLLLFVAFTVIVLARARRRPDLREVLLLLFTLAAALTSARHIPFFVLVAVPILSRRMPESIGSFRIAGSLEEAPTPVRSAVHFAVAVAAVVAAGIQIGSVLHKQDVAERAVFPVAAVKYMDEHAVSGPLYNNYDWGGYLIEHGYRVYVDGRADLYGDDFLTSSIRVYGAQGDWSTPLQQYGVQTVLIGAHAPLATVLRESREWQSLYEDSSAAVFTRRSGSDHLELK